MATFEEADQRILQDLLTQLERGTALPTSAEFRVRHEGFRSRIDRLQANSLIHQVADQRMTLTLAGVRALQSAAAMTALTRADALLTRLKDAYRERPGHQWNVTELGHRFSMSTEEVARIGTLLSTEPLWSSINYAPQTGFVQALAPAESILDAVALDRTHEPGSVLKPQGELREVRIDAFRGLRDVRLVDLARLNLLVGSNNSGKSSVLEAVGLFARPFDPGQWAQTAHSRDTASPVVEGIWGLFPGSTTLALEEEQSATLSVASGVQRLEVDASLSTTDDWPYSERSVDGEEYLALTITVRFPPLPFGTIRFDSRGRMQRQTPHWPGRKAFVVTPVTHRSTYHLAQHLSAATRAGTKAQLVELLRMFDGNVRDVDLTQLVGQEMIVVSHEKRGVVPLSSFGDGMRRAFAIAAALQRSRGGLLLIDELEAGIHRSALEPTIAWLVRAATQANVQVFAATHSLETVDAALAATVGTNDALVGFRMQRAEGTIVAARSDRVELERARVEGLDPR